jgi:hypothetical protein
MENCKYHCQHQAESFASSIIAVPDDYPLKKGLPPNFRVHFARLCGFAKNVYTDMAKDPEAYGLKLVDIDSTDHNLARDGYRTIHRFADTLNALFLSGNIADHCLHVNAEEFRAAAKPKYGLVLSKLCAFGFAISCFNGSVIDKKAVSFTVEYPPYPDMTDTIKTYCESWKELVGLHSPNRLAPYDGLIKVDSHNFHHRFYRFDYKITADLRQIPVKTWIKDSADGSGFSDQLKEFALAFFDESLKYSGIKFDGEYYCKSKRIARITSAGYGALGKPENILSLKLCEPDKYMDAINSMPDSVKGRFAQSYCRHCDFQGASPKHCKFRLHWTYAGQNQRGCAYTCFTFSDFAQSRVQDYWRLLELEYGLRKN